MAFFSAPLWCSAFRPFYLLGASYGVLFMLAWLGAYAELWPALLPGMPLRFWHGHEIVFGFAGAIITGIVLTALPTWTGTEEIKDGRLALLVALWLAGRIAVWLAPAKPNTISWPCQNPCDMPGSMTGHRSAYVPSHASMNSAP